MNKHTLIKGCWNTLGKPVKEPHSNHAVNTHFSQRTRILLAKRLLEIQVVSHQSNHSTTNSVRTIFWHSSELKVYVYVKRSKVVLERGTHRYE